MSGNPWSLGRLTRKRVDGSSYWHWCIKWADERGAHRVSLGTADRSAAEASAREFWARRAVAGADTVGQIVASYLDRISKTAGHKRKAEAWTAAKGFWAALRPDQIISDEPEQGIDGTGARYIEQRQRAANTVRKELGLIVEALSWARRNNMTGATPRIVLPAIPESTVDHLTKAQFRRFLAGCRAPHVRLFVQLAVTTGARVSALLELPWMRVDLERRIINLNPRGRPQKENKRRATVPINDRLLPLLVEAKEGAQSAFVIEQNGERIASIKKGMEAASVRSKIHCTPHMLRHSAAVWMAEARTPMEEIAAFLGHKDTRITTCVYARFHPDYLHRAAKALNW